MTVKELIKILMDESMDAEVRIESVRELGSARGSRAESVDSEWTGNREFVIITDFSE